MTTLILNFHLIRSTKRLLQSPAISHFSGQNNFLGILLSNHLSLCTFLYIEKQFSHPHEKTGKIAATNNLRLYATDRKEFSMQHIPYSAITEIMDLY
jgi:hypothetical protein